MSCELADSCSFWYHSHLDTQYCDGLRGAIVVYSKFFSFGTRIFADIVIDPDDPLKDLYDVDDEGTVITLAEWYHEFAPDNNNNFLTTGVVPYVAFAYNVTLGQLHSQVL
jgi:iron transport multicopper oxidase